MGGDWEVREVREGKANVRFGILRFCRCQKWSHTPRLDLGHQRNNWVLKSVLVRIAAFCCAEIFFFFRKSLNASIVEAELKFPGDLLQ